MNIQVTPKTNLDSKINNNSSKPQAKTSFKGAEVLASQALRFLETNQAVGASSVDLGCMVIPRTAVDSKRGPDAGLETFRREISGTANHMMIGVYGGAAAWALSRGINSKFGIQANRMFVSNDLTDLVGHHWHDALDAKATNPLNSVLTKIIGDLRGFNPDASAKLDGHTSIDINKQAEIIKKFEEIITKKGSDGKLLKEISKEDYAVLRSMIASELGSESSVVLDYKSLLDVTEKGVTKKVEKTVHSVKSSLASMIDGTYKLCKTFHNADGNSEIVNSFANGFKNNSLFETLRGLNKWTSIVGLAIAVGVGASIQPINMYLTKKKTGQTGFVGGGEADKTSSFKVLKTIVAAVGGFAIIRNIGKFSDLKSKIQFKGLIPTIDQFKLIYGTTIISRLLAARNKNELRESATKDTLGFVNWLILGGFVSKLTAMGLEKFGKDGFKFLRYHNEKNLTGAKLFFNKIMSANVVTRDEILFESLKKAGVSTIKKVGDKEVAMTFKEMMEEAVKVAPKTAKQMRYLNMIQLAGYLYSGIVLGVGIPKLNIAITKFFSKKDAVAEDKKQEEVAKIIPEENKTAKAA